MKTTTVLVVEDDNSIRNLIGTTLKSHDYQYLMASDGKNAILEASTHNPDVIFLDLGLPDIDGVQIIHKIRSWSNMPIIVISARSDDDDKLAALDAGADDYLTKPFSSMELLARVNAALRRYDRFLEMKTTGVDDKKAELLVNRGLELNTLTKEVRVDGKEVHLTPKEFLILELLMRNPGRVFSAAEIYESIWKEDALSTETITVHIRKLREKIEENPKKPVYLQVVWGLGYKLRRD